MGPDGNRGKGSDHPFAWFRTLEDGRTFYTSMGHQAGAFEEVHYLAMPECNPTYRQISLTYPTAEWGNSQTEKCPTEVLFVANHAE